MLLARNQGFSLSLSCQPEALISVLKFIEDDRSFTLENQPDCLPEPVEGQTS